MNNYDIFSGEDLIIADEIQRLRLQLLVHSCIYYEFNQNEITDMEWDSKAKRLVELQRDYPFISEKVIRYDDFKDWDGSTGAFLPLKDEWVLKKVYQLYRIRPKIKKAEEPKRVTDKKGHISLF